MNKTLVTAFCAAGLLMGTSVVMAQDAGMTPPPSPHEEMGPRPHELRGRHPEKMQDRLAEELKLTEEQKAELQKVRDENREKMKPLMEQMKELRKQMDDLRKADMDSFETILTPEQKKAFEEIKAKRHVEMKQKREKIRKDFGMRHGPRGERGADMLPPPSPAE